MASSRRSSSTNQTYLTVTDSRSVADNRHWNDSRVWNDNSVTVTNITDGGAIRAATGLSMAALEMSGNNAQMLINAVNLLSERTQHSLDKSAEIAQQMSINSVDIASGNKTIIIVAMGVIGAVAVMNMK